LHPGLTECLLGSASLKDATRTTEVEGLFVIPSGTSIPSPGDLLAGEPFRDFIAEVREAYDMVIIDTPPVLPVADAMAMRDRIDGFVFLYRAGFTPLAMFHEATEEIGEKKILGIVMNGVEPKADRHYTRYYGHYYTSQSKKETAG
jgi:capsular exopolysaccharide synthesis family protein